MTPCGHFFLFFLNFLQLLSEFIAQNLICFSGSFWHNSVVNDVRIQDNGSKNKKITAILTNKPN